MRLIDADALSKLVGEPIEVFLRRLDLKLPPSVDAVKVVRCKDCVYATRNDWGRIVCEVNNEPSLFSKTEDYFCAWGRRER